MLTCDTYHMPTTLREALELCSEAPAGSRLVSGATDILPWAREGRCHASRRCHLLFILQCHEQRLVLLLAFRADGGLIYRVLNRANSRMPIAGSMTSRRRSHC